jgi:DNA-binding NarL/FixJ family response regulator
VPDPQKPAKTLRKKGILPCLVKNWEGLGVAALRVLVVDGQRLMLAGIRHALEATADVEVVGETRSCSEVLALIDRTSPDLVLVDMQLPEVGGLTCLALIRERYPHVKAVMFSEGSEPEQTHLALDGGACGFIDKRIPIEALPIAIRRASEGELSYADGLDTARQLASGKDVALTERQIEILSLLASGRSNSAIASELAVTEGTVKFHLANIYRKFQVGNRTEAVHFALQHTLIRSQVFGWGWS